MGSDKLSNKVKDNSVKSSSSQVRRSVRYSLGRRYRAGARCGGGRRGAGGDSARCRRSLRDTRATAAAAHPRRAPVAVLRNESTANICWVRRAPCPPLAHACSRTHPRTPCQAPRAPRRGPRAGPPPPTIRRHRDHQLYCHPSCQIVLRLGLVSSAYA